VTSDEVAARLRRGGQALAFDTNVLFDAGALTSLCADVSKYNDRLAARGLTPVNERQGSEEFLGLTEIVKPAALRAALAELLGEAG